jgi:hypothetical protein
MATRIKRARGQVSHPSISQKECIARPLTTCSAPIADDAPLRPVGTSKAILSRAPARTPGPGACRSRHSESRVAPRYAVLARSVFGESVLLGLADLFIQTSPRPCLPTLFVPRGHFVK